MALQPDSAKLFLHLGPPKTATTALQLALQHGSDSYEYLGKFPGTAKGDAVSTWLHDGVVGGVDGDLAAQALERIRQVLESGRHAVLSEEMLLVDGAIAHQEKVTRVAELLRGLPVVAIVCLRDPAQALPSLFQERRQKLPIAEKLDFDAFLHGNQAKVFDYEHVARLADAFGDTRFIDFDDLTGGAINLRHLLGESADDITLEVGKTNVGTRGADGRRLPAIRIGDLVRNSRFLSRSARNKLARNRVIGPIWRRLASVEVAEGREQDLVVPESLADDLRRKWRHVQNQGERDVAV